jgi:peptidoglycan/xylan/chitin deacetylase (PgdA/CDA1 family)
VYPEVVLKITNKWGHELAWHGYQHEVWSGLTPEQEALNFRRSCRQVAEFGIKYGGFRPPGGAVNEGTYELLKANGMKYVSPLGKLGIGREGIVVLPFEWRAVDAFYYMDKFADVRKSEGEQEGVLTPEDFKKSLMAKIDETVRTGGFMSILFHPFLQTSAERLKIMDEVLARISGDPDIWCAPCKDVAKWVAEHPDNFESVE